MHVSRIYRLLRLVTLLQSGRPYSAAELAEELQVSRRTVFRDLNALELAHIPYYYDPESGGYRISKHFFLPPVNLTLPEAMAVLTLAERAGSNAGVPLLAPAAQAAAKIQSALPQSLQDHVGGMVRGLGVQLGPMAAHDRAEPLFDRLADAIHRRRVCQARYQSFLEGQSLRLVLHPLRLLFLHRAWYLLAWTPTEKQVRTYKLVRFEDLDITDRTFPARDVPDPFGQAWAMIPEGKIHHVHLHFEPKVAGNVAEVQWHATQRVAHNDDGSIEFHADVDGLGEITWWVLGYGDQVTVRQPSALAERILAVARNILDRYDTKGATS